jgi:hypothetical protein
MANYKESQVSGTSWTRSYRVELENPLNDIPRIIFAEEDVYLINGETVTKEIIRHPVYSAQDNLSDPTVAFDILSPVDDSVVGTATYQDVYVLLYSLYQALAIRRDIAKAASNPISQ